MPRCCKERRLECLVLEVVWTQLWWLLWAAEQQRGRLEKPWRIRLLFCLLPCLHWELSSRHHWAGSSWAQPWLDTAMAGQLKSSLGWTDLFPPLLCPLSTLHNKEVKTLWGSLGKPSEKSVFLLDIVQNWPWRHTKGNFCDNPFWTTMRLLLYMHKI